LFCCAKTQTYGGFDYDVKVRKCWVEVGDGVVLFVLGGLFFRLKVEVDVVGLGGVFVFEWLFL
jgi:hypothetical protein